MSRAIVDDLTLETYALLVDQALCESEAVASKRLTRSEVEQIVVRELEGPGQSMEPSLHVSLVNGVTRLVVEERGYTSPLAGNERVLPAPDEPERESFWRTLARFRVAR